MQLLDDYEGPIELILTCRDLYPGDGTVERHHYLNIVGDNPEVDNGDLAYSEDCEYPSAWAGTLHGDLWPIHDAFANIIVRYGERIKRIEAQDPDSDPVGKKVADYYSARLAALRGTEPQVDRCRACGHCGRSRCRGCDYDCCEMPQGQCPTCDRG